MELSAMCMRCGHEFFGPDEGCPECDKNKPTITYKRNRFADGRHFADCRDDLVNMLSEEAVKELEERIKNYPDYKFAHICKLHAIEPNHPDRFTRPYKLADGTMSQPVEYTHLFEIYYHPNWCALYGITTDKKVHLWAD